MAFFKMLENKHNIILNPGQKKVAAHKDGPILAIAVPGSGKTTTMMCRTGFLVESHGVDPGRILSVTFSRASALDMKTRYQSIFGQKGRVPEFSTIHSFANGCINRFDGEKMRTVKIIGSRGVPSQEQVVGEAFKFLKIYANPEKVKEAALLIGYVRNAMLENEEIEELDSQVEGFGKILERYEELKRDNNLIDFDDMLLMAYRLLKDRPDALSFYQNAYDYFQIDEAQDTSKLQHEIFALISGRSANLLMCGDEDQSIYGWRGAAPSYMMEFGKMHPGAVIARLEKNYRSTKRIVGAMNSVIKLNENRYKKTMHTENEEGEAVRIERPESVLDQNHLIVEELRELGAEETAAVIYRRNRSGLLMAHELWRANIPFGIEKSRVKDFFYQSVFRDVTSFCKLVDNPFDTKSFRQVYHKMGLFISKDAMETIVNNGGLTEANIRNLGLRKSNTDKIIKRLQVMKRIKNMSARLLFEELQDSWGYLDYLDDAGDAFGYQKNSSKAIFHMMKSMIQANETPGQYCNRLRSFWSAIDKMNGKGSVSLSAVHSVKGLEFDRVYLIDLVKDEFPFKAAASGDDLAGGCMEEERCLFYVAGTRAKSKLCLLSPKEFYGDPDASPSPFLSEMGIKLPVEANAEKEIARARGYRPAYEKRGQAKASVKRIPDPGMRFAVSIDQLELGKAVKINKFGAGVIETINRNDDRLAISVDGKIKTFKISIVLQNKLLQLPVSDRGTGTCPT